MIQTEPVYLDVLYALITGRWLETSVLGERTCYVKNLFVIDDCLQMPRNN